MQLVKKEKRFIKVLLAPSGEIRLKTTRSVHICAFCKVEYIPAEICVLMSLLRRTRNVECRCFAMTIFGTVAHRTKGPPVNMIVKKLTYTISPFFAYTVIKSFSHTHTHTYT